MVKVVSFRTLPMDRQRIQAVQRYLNEQTQGAVAVDTSAAIRWALSTVASMIERKSPSIKHEETSK